MVQGWRGGAWKKPWSRDGAVRRGRSRGPGMEQWGVGKAIVQGWSGGVWGKPWSRDGAVGPEFRETECGLSQLWLCRCLCIAALDSDF